LALIGQRSMNISDSSSIPLVIFSLILTAYIIGSVFVAYHLYHFGIGKAPKAILIIFLAGSGILIGMAVWAYLQVDWGFLPYEDFMQYLNVNSNLSL